MGVAQGLLLHGGGGEGLFDGGVGARAYLGHLHIAKEEVTLIGVGGEAASEGLLLLLHAKGGEGVVVVRLEMVCCRLIKSRLKRRSIFVFNEGLSDGNCY